MVLTMERRLAFAGCSNFRDLGGYRAADGRSVRWRTLFRSDALHHLTGEDVAQLRDVGLRTVIDLRTPRELEQTGLGLLCDDGLVFHCHAPFTASVGERPRDLGTDLGVLYLRMLDGASECIRQVFSLLAEPERYPLVFHCAGGKDRTGMVAAIVLRTLGVADDEIVADYALTDRYIGELMEARRQSGEFAMYGEIAPEMLRSRPETMTRLLSAIDERHGAVEDFLVSCGVAVAQIERMRVHLLTDAG